jgi:transposase
MWLWPRKELAMKTILFCGVDLHKDSMTICLLLRNGTVRFEVIPTKCKGKIVEFFTTLGKRYRCSVAVESVGFYQWFWDLVQPLVHRITLADASKVRAAAGRRAKTDRNDAQTIARLLLQDSLPTAFVPDMELRDIRTMVRHRERICRRITSCKNSIRMEMNKLNFAGPKNLNSASFHRWYTAQFQKIANVTRISFEDLAELLSLLEKQLRHADERLQRAMKDNPRMAQHVQRYMTIPGIGFFTATVLLAETGGLERFDLEQEIICYAGFAPRTFQSADTCRRGRIGKDGPPIVRKCLINAAWTAVRCNRGIKVRFEQWRKRSGKKKAIVKLAAKMLTWAWAMERRKEEFDPKRLAA